MSDAARRRDRGARTARDRARCISCRSTSATSTAIPRPGADLRKDFGPIYGLVNNAALGTDGVLAIMHNSQIEELVRVNTVSPIVLTKYVVRSMMADGGGRIVNIASIIGFTGYSGLSVYGATKASIIGFTRSLAREVGRLGINVNAVAPGFIDTEMTQGLGRASSASKVARRSALRRLAEVDDVANAVEFLLGDKAAKHHRHGADGGCRQHGVARPRRRLMLEPRARSPAAECAGRNSARVEPDDRRLLTTRSLK